MLGRIAPTHHFLMVPANWGQFRLSVKSYVKGFARHSLVRWKPEQIERLFDSLMQGYHFALNDCPTNGDNRLRSADGRPYPTKSNHLMSV